MVFADPAAARKISCPNSEPCTREDWPKSRQSGKGSSLDTKFHGSTAPRRSNKIRLTGAEDVYLSITTFILSPDEGRLRGAGGPFDSRLVAKQIAPRWCP